MCRTFVCGLLFILAQGAWAQDGRYFDPPNPRSGFRGATIQEVTPPPVQTGNFAPDPFTEPPTKLVPIGTPVVNPPSSGTNSPPGRSSFVPENQLREIQPATALSPVENPTATAPASPLVTPQVTTTAEASPPMANPNATAEEESAIAEFVEDGAAATWQKIMAVWNYPITSVDGKTITPGTVLCCLLLLWIGYLASRTISWWFGSRFLPRLGMHQSAVAPVQTITFYVLVATFTMMSLRLANVPLTAFTFLGGAIAIGVGFGSQNVVNNFISGLILLAERPIRVGDVIQVEGFTGTVTQIGPRSTQVTTSTNVVIVLPNSKLLEGTVVNWTLSDDRIRTKIVAGVSYGSRTRDVEQFMLAAARSHEAVLSDPAPFVVFAEFGDNALQFELHFWLALNGGTARSEVESDIRFDIDERFRTAGIVMAYPQRDVHLNVLRPVEIRMVESANDRTRARAA